MGSRCLDQVWHRHREPWGWMELGGYCLASTGGWMSILSGKPTNYDLRSEVAIDPKQTSNYKTTRKWF
jgi:hypothetical protein